MKNKTEFLAQLGHNIRQCRQQGGSSQERVAKQAKIARRYYGDIEAGRINPSIITLIKIALTLQVPLETLVPTSFSLEELVNDV